MRDFSFYTHIPILLVYWMLNPIHAQLPEKTFRHLDYRDGLPEYSVLDAMVTDHLGRLWFGYTAGLYQYDGYEIRSFVPDIRDSHALPSLAISTLYMDPQNRLWIGTRNMGVCIYDARTDRFERMLPVSEGGIFPVGLVWDIFCDSTGIYWFCADPGLIRFDPQRNSFRHFTFTYPEYSEEDIAFFNTMRFIRPSPSEPGMLWIGTRAGLLSFDTSSEKFTHHSMPFSSEEIGLRKVDYMIFKFVFTSHEDLWASTWGGGILHYHLPTKIWNQYRNARVAPKDDIGFSLTPRDEHTFWYGTTKSFGIFNHTQKKYSFYKTTKESPGALLWCQMFSGYEKTADGADVIGGTLGISISLPESPKMKMEYPYAPFLTRIMVNHQPFPSSLSPPYTSNITLQEEQNTLHFTASLPAYHHTERVVYRFRLEGIDATWLESSPSRSVQYTNLKPGQYKLYYQASLDGMHWIDGITSPEIQLTRPFWRHPLFLLGLAMLLTAIIAMFIQLHIRHIRREAQLKMQFNQRLAENEMKALRAQMNPHFMFNSLNSIKNYILKENKREASKYLTKFSKLMRAILANSEHKLVSLDDELQALTLYLEIEAMRLNDEFDFLLFVDPRIDKARTFLPPLLIQPFVENAIWHGLMPKTNNRKLSISLIPDNGNLVISIEDNGIGRKAAAFRKEARQNHEKSFGMKLTHDRIALVKSTMDISAEITVTDLEAYDHQPSGTRVTITIPHLTEPLLSKSNGV